MANCRAGKDPFPPVLSLFGCIDRNGTKPDGRRVREAAKSELFTAQAVGAPVTAIRRSRLDLPWGNDDPVPM
jgi:hypothetical protein